MTIIRIRTSEELYKINVSSLDITLDDLKKLLQLQSNLPIEKMIFSYDIIGRKVILDTTKSLKLLELESGSLIYLLGRIIKDEVVKSTIGEKGQLINKGITYDIVHDIQSEYFSKFNSNLKSSADENRTPNVNTTDKIPDEDKTTESLTQNTMEKQNRDPKEFAYEDYSNFSDDLDGVRPADPIRKMRLMDDDSERQVPRRPIFPHIYTNDSNFDNDTLSHIISAGVPQEELLASLINDGVPSRRPMRSDDRFRGNISMNFDNPIDQSLDITDEEFALQLHLLKEYEKKSINNYDVKNKRVKESKEIDKTNLVPVTDTSSGSYEYVSPSLVDSNIRIKENRKDKISRTYLDTMIDSKVIRNASSREDVKISSKNDVIEIDNDSDIDPDLELAIKQSLLAAENDQNNSESKEKKSTTRISNVTSNYSDQKNFRPSNNFAKKFESSKQSYGLSDSKSVNKRDELKDGLDKMADAFDRYGSSKTLKGVNKSTDIRNTIINTETARSSITGTVQSSRSNSSNIISNRSRPRQSSYISKSDQTSRSSINNQSEQSTRNSIAHPTSSNLSAMSTKPASNKRSITRPIRTTNNTSSNNGMIFKGQNSFHDSTNNDIEDNLEKARKVSSHSNKPNEISDEEKSKIFLEDEELARKLQLEDNIEYNYNNMDDLLNDYRMIQSNKPNDISDVEKSKNFLEDEELARKLHLEDKIEYDHNNIDDLENDYRMIREAIKVDEPDVYYDEEDEMLARALQESLNS